MSADLHIELTGSDGSPPLLEVAGEIDLSNVERFRRALSRGEAEGSPLAVDMSRVTYIDSAGMAALFRRARRGGLHIVAGPDSVMASLIRITRLDLVASVRPG